MKRFVQIGTYLFSTIILFFSVTNYVHALVRTNHPMLHQKKIKFNQNQTPFVKNIDTLYKSKLIESCDLKFKKIRYELAQYLDDNNETIIKLYNQLVNTDNEIEITNIGKMVVRLVKEEPSPDKFITSFDSSWEQLSTDFNKIKTLDLSSKLTNEQIKAVYKTLKDFKYILSNDSDRLEGFNLFMDKDSGIVLSSMNKKIESCLSIKTCKKMNFIGAEASLVELYSKYKTALTAFNKNGNKDNLSELQSAIEEDLSYFAIRENASVFIKGGRIELPLVLDPNLLAGQETFSSIVESIWTSSDLKLKLLFKEPSEDLFKVVFFNQPGGRSSVNYTDQAIKLYQDVRSRSIAHEIGHVLGFYDNYFTQWRPQTCEYFFQHNPADIMSDVYGKVLSSHWKTLKDIYKK